MLRRVDVNVFGNEVDVTTQTPAVMRVRRWIHAVAALVVVSLVAAGCGGSGDDDLEASTVTEASIPLTKVTTTTMAKPTTTESAPETTTTMVATTTTTTEAPSPGFGPFPETVPTGECTKESIRASTDVDLVWGPDCSGPWAVGQGFVCPPDLVCEGIDIMRWTDNGWQYRNLHNAYCVWSVQMSGMSRAVNDQLIGFNDDCAEPISFSAEPVSGPLGIGDEGPRVARLQQALVDLRLLDDSADGYFGPNTYSAVIDLQFLAGIEVSQQADGPTHDVLGLPFN